MSNVRPSQAFSIASVLSIVCATASFFVGAIPAIILAIFAIFFGSFGALLSLSPHRRGGVMSTFAMVVGVIGILVAIVKAVFLWLV